MARKDVIEVEGRVVELLPNTMFRVELPWTSDFGAYFRKNADCISFGFCQATRYAPKSDVHWAILPETSYLAATHYPAFNFDDVFSRHVKISGFTFGHKNCVFKMRGGRMIDRHDSPLVTQHLHGGPPHIDHGFDCQRHSSLSFAVAAGVR